MRELKWCQLVCGGSKHAEEVARSQVAAESRLHGESPAIAHVRTKQSALSWREHANSESQNNIVLVAAYNKEI